MDDQASRTRRKREKMRKLRMNDELKRLVKQNKNSRKQLDKLGVKLDGALKAKADAAAKSENDAIAIEWKTVELRKEIKAANSNIKKLDKIIDTLQQKQKTHEEKLGWFKLKRRGSEALQDLNAGMLRALTKDLEEEEMKLKDNKEKCKTLKHMIGTRSSVDKLSCAIEHYGENAKKLSILKQEWRDCVEKEHKSTLDVKKMQRKLLRVKNEQTKMSKLLKVGDNLSQIPLKMFLGKDQARKEKKNCVACSFKSPLCKHGRSRSSCKTCVGKKQVFICLDCQEREVNALASAVDAVGSIMERQGQITSQSIEKTEEDREKLVKQTATLKSKLEELQPLYLKQKGEIEKLIGYIEKMGPGDVVEPPGTTSPPPLCKRDNDGKLLFSPRGKSGGLFMKNKRKAVVLQTPEALREKREKAAREKAERLEAKRQRREKREAKIALEKRRIKAVRLLQRYFRGCSGRQIAKMIMLRKDEMKKELEKEKLYKARLRELEKKRELEKARIAEEKAESLARLEREAEAKAKADAEDARALAHLQELKEAAERDRQRLQAKVHALSESRRRNAMREGMHAEKLRQAMSKALEISRAAGISAAMFARRAAESVSRAQRLKNTLQVEAAAADQAIKIALGAAVEASVAAKAAAARAKRCSNDAAQTRTKIKIARSAQIAQLASRAARHASNTCMAIVLRQHKKQLEASRVAVARARQIASAAARSASGSARRAEAWVIEAVRALSSRLEDIADAWLAPGAADLVTKQEKIDVLNDINTLQKIEVTRAMLNEPGIKASISEMRRAAESLGFRKVAVAAANLDKGMKMNLIEQRAKEVEEKLKEEEASAEAENERQLQNEIAAKIHTIAGRDESIDRKIDSDERRAISQAAAEAALAAYQAFTAARDFSRSSNAAAYTSDQCKRSILAASRAAAGAARSASISFKKSEKSILFAIKHIASNLNMYLRLSRTTAAELRGQDKREVLAAMRLIDSIDFSGGLLKRSGMERCLQQIETKCKHRLPKVSTSAHSILDRWKPGGVGIAGMYQNRPKRKRVFHLDRLMGPKMEKKKDQAKGIDGDEESKKMKRKKRRGKKKRTRDMLTRIGINKEILLRKSRYETRYHSLVGFAIRGREKIGVEFQKPEGRTSGAAVGKFVRDINHQAGSVEARQDVQIGMELLSIDNHDVTSMKMIVLMDLLRRVERKSKILLFGYLRKRPGPGAATGKENHSATLIQAQARGFLARRHRQHGAATVMQARARGFIVRTRISNGLPLTDTPDSDKYSEYDEDSDIEVDEVMHSNGQVYYVDKLHGVVYDRETEEQCGVWANDEIVLGETDGGDDSDEDIEVDEVDFEGQTYYVDKVHGVVYDQNTEEECGHWINNEIVLSTDTMNADGEGDDDDDVNVDEIDFEGKTYYVDKVHGIVYDFNSEEEVGKWKDEAVVLNGQSTDTADVEEDEEDVEVEEFEQDGTIYLIDRKGGRVFDDNEDDIVIGRFFNGRVVLDRQIGAEDKVLPLFDDSIALRAAVKLQASFRRRKAKNLLSGERKALDERVQAWAKRATDAAIRLQALQRMRMKRVGRNK
jgi:hypothetical protein